MNKENTISQIMEFGFSELEAKVYINLLQNADITGYRLAQIMNKPIANLYKALDSLHRKGVILVDLSGKKKLYHAMPIDKFFDTLEDQFQKKRKSVEDALREIKPIKPEEGMYTIEEYSQLFNIASTVLASSRAIVMVNAGEDALKLLDKEIKACVERGVSVFIKTTSELNPEGCHMIREHDELYYRSNRSNQWLNIIADSKEQLIAFINSEHQTVYQGLWVQNIFTVTVAYSGMAHDFILNQFLTQTVENFHLSESLVNLKRLQKDLMENIQIKTILSELFKT